MGIKGLLVELRPITNRIHISEFKGKRLAVDASCWLHRAAFTCTMQLVLGKPTKAWLSWCICMTEMLLQNGVTPVFVFDGIALPQKMEENHRRRDQRNAARERGLELMQAGNTREASAIFQQAISISPEMQRDFILALRSRNIEYIVAPYEADAQLGFLFQSGNVHAVISEDSDLVLFGVRRLVSKFAKDGFGELTDMALLNSTEAKKHRFTEALQSLSHEQFLAMCIMSGCDYVDGLPGIGLKTALKYAREHITPERMLRAYRRKNPMPADYNAKFKRALLTFQHQRVYDPSTGTLCHLSGVERLEDDGEFLGAALEEHIVKNLVIGALNTKTMAVEPFSNTESELIQPLERPASVPVQPTQSSGLKVYSDQVEVRQKKRKDFSCDVQILKDIFGDARPHVQTLSNFAENRASLKSEHFEELSYQSKLSSGTLTEKEQENQAPERTKAVKQRLTASPDGPLSQLNHVPKAGLHQPTHSGKRPAPTNSKSWVKRLRKPAQHVQRRLTEFFSIKLP